MIRHVTTEELSAYLDLELGFAEVRQIEAHCAACGECGVRLASMRRVVGGLGRVERAAPPPALRQHIRRQVQQTPTGGWRAALGSLRLLLFPPQPALRTSAALGLAVVAGLFAVIHGMAGEFFRASTAEPRPRKEIVKTYPGVPWATLQQTTSEVAGRKFLWTERAGWVQRGLEGETPVIVDAGSPQGRELLGRYSDLELLLADGSSVVLRYKLETVELRKPSAAGRELGYFSRSGHRTLSA